MNSSTERNEKTLFTQISQFVLMCQFPSGEGGGAMRREPPLALTHISGEWHQSLATTTLN